MADHPAQTSTVRDQPFTEVPEARSSRLTVKVVKYGSRTNGQMRWPPKVIARGMMAVTSRTLYCCGMMEVVLTTIPAYHY
jgi:hypothetical protein